VDAARFVRDDDDDAGGGLTVRAVWRTPAVVRPFRPPEDEDP
jgi:hypothetical protein